MSCGPRRQRWRCGRSAKAKARTLTSPRRRRKRRLTPSGRLATSAAPWRNPPRLGRHFRRILLAEHDSFDRRLLRVLLTSPRISLIEVEDGQSAVDLLSLLEFDLLMINLDLPQMTGEDTIRWIRRSRTSWADIPILGLADQKHQSDVERLVSLGLTDWTPKPVVRQHLIEKIISLDAGPLRRAALAPADTVASG